MAGPSEKGERRIIVRMIQADRQAITRMMKHKRGEFENVLRKGIVSMLNAEDERRELSDQIGQWFGSLSARTQRKKEQTHSAVSLAKDATSGAPMGIGGAANLAITGVGAVRNAMLDNAEARRQETEAQAQYRSAQMMHYMTAVNYDAIAKRVASILGYRLQFLLFRLAAGEDGYIKLANFLVASMNEYAVVRLREHKGEEVKALIDAAIPPSTNALNYREWPKVDVVNFKVQPRFGTRKRLELDEDANFIIARCGDAVRKLTGAYKVHVCTVTQEVTAYKPFTIIGALNHAPILTSRGEVIAGIETAHRKNEALDGMNKYPMILLGLGETTADLGVNFATKPKNQFLEDEHVEALSRLVPNFFSHEVNYKLEPDVATAEPELEGNAYTTERYECPWTEVRELAWQARTKQLHVAAKNVVISEQEEVVAASNEYQVQAMEAASYEFDANEVQKEVITITRQARQAQAALDLVDVNVPSQDGWMTAVTASNDAALAVQELMRCASKCSWYERDYFGTAHDAIEAAKAALHVIHRLPLEEASKRKKMMVMLDKASHHAEAAFKQQRFCQENFQIALDFLQTTSKFPAGNEFYIREEAARLRVIKTLRASIKEDLDIASRVIEVSRVFEDEADSKEDPPQQAVVLDEFNVAALNVRKVLVGVDAVSDEMVYIDIIKLCMFETQKNYDVICASLKVEDVWVTAEYLDGSNQAEKKVSMKAAAKAAKDEASKALQAAEERVARPLKWQQSLYGSSGRIAHFKSCVQSAVQARDTSVLLLKGVKLREDNTLNSEQGDVFLLRAVITAEINHVHLLSRKKEAHQIKPETHMMLEQALCEFDVAAKRLDVAMKRGYHHAVGLANQDVIARADGFMKKTRLNALLEQARNVRQARENVEKAGMDDVDAICFAERKALLAVAEAEGVLEAMEVINEKLNVLQAHCFVDVEANQGASLSFDTQALDALLEAFDPNALLRITDGHVAHHQDGDVAVVLLHLLGSCVDKESSVGLTEDALKAEVFSKLLNIKQAFSKTSGQCLEHWKVWLVAEMTSWVVQNVQKKLVEHVSGTKNMLSTIQDAMRDIPPELTCAIDAAMHNIKQASQAVYDAKHGQREVSKRSHEGGRDVWSLVSSTLDWAGRLTYAERKWSREHRMNKSIQGLDSAPTGKSLMRMFHSFLFEYSKDKVEETKEALGQLNKFEKSLMQCHKQLCDMKEYYRALAQKKPDNLERALQLYQRLTELFYKKHEQEEHAGDDADEFKKIIKAQRVRVHFNDWKFKTYDPDAQSERLKAIRLATEARVKHEQQVQLKQGTRKNSSVVAEVQTQNDTQMEHMKVELKLEDDALNITLENMKEMLSSVKAYLGELHQAGGILGKTSSCYGSMFSPQRGTGSKAEKPTDDMAEERDGEEVSVHSMSTGDLAAHDTVSGAPAFSS